MGRVTVAVTVASVVIGAVAATVAVRRTDRLTRAAALAAGVGIAATSMATAGFALAGLRFFGLLHLLYVVATVSVPMVGAAFVVGAVRARARRATAIGSAVLGAVLVAPALLGWWATHVEPYRLTTEYHRLVVDDVRTGSDPVRIAVLADLQTGRISDHERNAIDRIQAAEPDLILVAGDLFQGSGEAFARVRDEFRDLLDGLEAPSGVFFVRGDVDDHERTQELLAGTDITVLDDRITEVAVGDRTILLGGNQVAYRNDRAAAIRRRLAVESGDGAIRILLSHRPDAVLDLPSSSRIDLVVAGHTHGGQVVVPGFGPLVTMSDVPRAIARGGLHRHDGNAILVSRGVGLERGRAPQVRLFSRPSVDIVDLVDLVDG